jgi:hypothetical protein
LCESCKKSLRMGLHLIVSLAQCGFWGILKKPLLCHANESSYGIPYVLNVREFSSRMKMLVIHGIHGIQIIHVIHEIQA